MGVWAGVTGGGVMVNEHQGPLGRRGEKEESGRVGGETGSPGHGTSLLGSRDNSETPGILIEGNSERSGDLTKDIQSLSPGPCSQASQGMAAVLLKTLLHRNPLTPGIY